MPTLETICKQCGKPYRLTCDDLAQGPAWWPDKCKQLAGGPLLSALIAMALSLSGSIASGARAAGW